MKGRISASGDLSGVFRLNTGSDTDNADPDVLGPKEAGTITGHVALQDWADGQPVSSIRPNYRSGMSSKGYTPDAKTFSALFAPRARRPP